MMEYILISQLVLPLFIASFLFLGTNKNIAYFVTIVTTGILAISSVFITYYSLQNNYKYYFGGWLPPMGIELIVNPTNAIMINLISFSAFFTFVFGHSYFFMKNNIKHSLFCSLFLISLTGLCGITLTNDFFNLYVFIEISSIALYALTAVDTLKAAQAAFNYLVIGTIGAVLILFGIGFLYSASGTLNIDHFIKLLPHLKNSKLISLGIYLFVTGLILKSALFPLHNWLIDLYKNTNQIILPFISAVSTKIYIFILIKILTIVFPHYSLVANQIKILAAIGLIITSISATQQNTLRDIFAFSTLANICYIMFALSTRSPLKLAMILIVSHSITKFVLFILTNYILQTKKTDRLNSLYNLLCESPLIAALFIINIISLVGIPFSIGFVGKFYLLTEIIYEKNWTFIPMVIATFIGLIYAWKIIDCTITTSSDAAIYQYQNINITKYGVLVLTLINVLLGTYFIMTSTQW